MYTKLLAHKRYVSDQLAKNLTLSERDSLYQYHRDQVHNFQHERLIHLLVTFFFALLFLLALVAFLLTPLESLRIPLGILTLILLCLEAAYIHHYYRLENSVQSLYELTERFASRD